MAGAGRGFVIDATDDSEFATSWSSMTGTSTSHSPTTLTGAARVAS